MQNHFFFCAFILLFAWHSTAMSDQTKENEQAPLVAIIGTGDMGNSLGPKLIDAGYSVIYGSRRPDEKKVLDLVAAGKGKARSDSQAAAAKLANIVLLTVPWPAMKTVAQNLGSLRGKIVIDASLPYKRAVDGYMESSVATSSGEMIQTWNPDALVVKVGFPGSFLIDNPVAMGERASALIAADDSYAKETVANIIQAIGIRPFDAGPLRHARYIEAMGMLYMVPLAQGKDEGWEFFVRSNSFWPCRSHGALISPTIANGKPLAEFPKSDELPINCEQQPIWP